MEPLMRAHECCPTTQSGLCEFANGMKAYDGRVGLSVAQEPLSALASNGVAMLTSPTIVVKLLMHACLVCDRSAYAIMQALTCGLTE